MSIMVCPTKEYSVFNFPGVGPKVQARSRGDAWRKWRAWKKAHPFHEGVPGYDSESDEPPPPPEPSAPQLPCAFESYLLVAMEHAPEHKVPVVDRNVVQVNGELLEDFLKAHGLESQQTIKLGDFVKLVRTAQGASDPFYLMYEGDRISRDDFAPYDRSFLQGGGDPIREEMKEVVLDEMSRLQDTVEMCVLVKRSYKDSVNRKSSCVDA